MVYEKSMAELQRQLMDICEANQQPETLEPEDRGEYLAILFQILASSPTAEIVQRTLVDMKAHLGSRLTQREHRVLSRAVPELLAKADYALLDQVLPIIIRYLRRTGIDAVVRFLVQLSDTIAATDREALWPHVVNETLLGQEHGDPLMTGKLRRWSGLLSEEAMRRGMRRLENLEALAEGRISHWIFHAPISPVTLLFPVFAQLLYSSQAQLVGNNLMRTFRERPPQWIGAEIFQLIDDYKPKYRKFLLQLLQEKALEQASPDLQAQTVDMLVTTLEALPVKRRGDPLVWQSIRALGNLPAQRAKSILQEIVTAKKLLFFPEWPSPCRREARWILSHLADERPKGEKN
jgi:hypothetical protein